MDKIEDVFGKITPPPGSEGLVGSDPLSPLAGAGKLLVFGIRLTLIIAGIFLLIYLLWGGFDWITSGGEKEKVVKAREKITEAFIGILIIVIALTIFQVIAGNILGIVTIDKGWIFQLPILK